MVCIIAVFEESLGALCPAWSRVLDSLAEPEVSGFFLDGAGAESSATETFDPGLPVAAVFGAAFPILPAARSVGTRETNM